MYDVPDGSVPFAPPPGHFKFGPRFRPEQDSAVQAHWAEPTRYATAESYSSFTIHADAARVSAGEQTLGNQILQATSSGTCRP